MQPLRQVRRARRGGDPDVAHRLTAALPLADGGTRVIGGGTAAPPVTRSGETAAPPAREDEVPAAAGQEGVYQLVQFQADSGS